MEKEKPKPSSQPLQPFQPLQSFKFINHFAHLFISQILIVLFNKKVHPTQQKVKHQKKSKKHNWK
jgi:hypothetical protein